MAYKTPMLMAMATPIFSRRYILAPITITNFHGNMAKTKSQMAEYTVVVEQCQSREESKVYAEEDVPATNMP